MKPIWDLLNRIRWDAEFGRGRFELGYFDRVKHQTLVVPFQALEFFPDNPHTFGLADEEGRFHRVPFHRVREVWKDGKSIWRR